MKILSAEQIRKADKVTIAQEPIRSIDLMERASIKVKDWIVAQIPNVDLRIAVFCGPGNNGGDGLAVARLLNNCDYLVDVYLLNIGPYCSPDYLLNLKRLPKRSYVQTFETKEGDDIPDLSKYGVVIDAIFGSGLSRPISDYWASLVASINSSDAKKISIDIPSGMYADASVEGIAVTADHTLSFQCPKLAFFMAENDRFIGQWTILDIGLDPTYLENINAKHEVVTHQLATSCLQSRRKFDHKGTFGHALLICGGYGKVGAALLAAKACLRGGVGKLTVHVPRYAYQVMQLGMPEAMVHIDKHDFWFSGVNSDEPFESIGVGCGIGQKQVTKDGLKSLIDSTNEPMILDADALNILAKNHSWLKELPMGSILTPHPGEYKRLFDKTENDFERLEQQIDLSRKLNLFIIYKCANTCITTPDGMAYFNVTGNPGMATAGSGDVLTGLITGLLAQYRDPLKASLLGVYLHGLAGDLAAKTVGQHGLIASDIIDHLPEAFMTLESIKSNYGR